MISKIASFSRYGDETGTSFLFWAIGKRVGKRFPWRENTIYSIILDERLLQSTTIFSSSSFNKYYTQIETMLKSDVIVISFKC